MIWVFWRDGKVQKSDIDPGDCPKVKCATFRERGVAEEKLTDPGWREKLLRKNLNH